MKLGFHVSISGSIDKSVDRALENNCSTFQIFSRNPRSWSSSPISEVEKKLFLSKITENDIFPVFLHMPYIFNLSSPNTEIFEKSIQTLKDEIERSKQLNIQYIVMHLGSCLGKDREKSVQKFSSTIKEILDVNIPNLLLENNSGSKNGIGSKFEELMSILNIINDKRVGLCIDTCHAFTSGYDLRNNIDDFIQKIEENFGLNRLKLIHLNDSKHELGSGFDQHEHIGLGKIGVKGFTNILNSVLINFPMIMETPVDKYRGNVENMLTVKKLAKK